MFIYNPQLDSRTVSRIAFATLQYTVPYGTVRTVDSTVQYSCVQCTESSAMYHTGSRLRRLD